MTLDVDTIIAEARSWLGTPYHHQAARKGAGCDCLGLVRGVYEELVGPLPDPPPYSRDWAEARRRETLLDAAMEHLVSVGDPARRQPGDVLIFRLTDKAMAKHSGILTGPDRMVHAQENAGCVEVYLGRWWRRRIAGVFRFPGVEG